MTGVYREVIFGQSVLHNTKLEVAIEVKTGQTILYSVMLLFLDIANASQGWVFNIGFCFF